MSDNGLRAIIAVCALVVLSACDEEPQCKKNPSFYLKGTVYDCDAVGKKQEQEATESGDAE